MQVYTEEQTPKGYMPSVATSNSTEKRSCHFLGSIFYNGDIFLSKNYESFE